MNFRSRDGGSRSIGCRAVIFAIYVGALVGAAAPAESGNDARIHPRLTIRFYNYPSAHGAEVAEMAKVTKWIFNASGIDTRWIQCSPTLVTDPNVSECKSDLDYRTISLLLMNDISSTGSDVLGSAIEGTSTVKVAYNRIQGLHCRFPDFSCGLILGHVAAHEIGHSLLGLKSHTAAGIMRPSFSVCDLQEMSRGKLLFFPEQSRLLRSRVLGLSQASE
jgi:hypothetical protein